MVKKKFQNHFSSIIEIFGILAFYIRLMFKRITLAIANWYNYIKKNPQIKTIISQPVSKYILFSVYICVVNPIIGMIGDDKNRGITIE